MIKKKSTKRNLLLSFVSLLLCFAMLAGTTYAWFTDSVTSAANIIMSGNLDIELYHANSTTNEADEKVDENTLLFADVDSGKWEPGAMAWEKFTVLNNGTLALKYEFALNVADATVIDGISFAKMLKVAIVDADFVYDRTNVNAIPKSEWKDLASFETIASSANGLLKNESDSFGVVIWWEPSENDNLFNMNNENNGEIVSVSVGVVLNATQFTSESDAFGPDYDADAIFPEVDTSFVAVADVKNKVDANDQLTEDITVGDPTDGRYAIVGEGTKLEPGATEIVLTLKTTERSGNIEMTGGQVSRSLDAHITGIAKDNTVPSAIYLGEIMPKDYKDASIQLIHVENGVPVQMTSVDALTAHNQYVYDPATGGLFVNMATFSEVTAVVAAGDPWDGTLDVSWYNTTDTVFTLTTEEQFAGFGAIVGGMVTDGAGNRIQDDFKGKTVKLGADLNMGGDNGAILYPVGYYNTSYSYDRTSESITSNVSSFEGTFDGQSYTLSNIYQNTWEMFGDYNSGYPAGSNYYKDGMGIFGFVYNGTIKNLVVRRFSSDGEFSTTGCVAAYTSGSSTFENIAVYNSNPRAYNVPNGGVVGYAYAEDGATNVINFNNVTVDASNKITALWGSWDVGCGGILGRVNGDTTINMNNCTVGAIIDVYNDVCGNYQYYQYRYAGMLIGTVGGDTDPTSGAEKVNFSNVKVYIGSWADYYYCEFAKNSSASYSKDYQFSRVEKNEINIDPTTNLPYDPEILSPCKHKHLDDEDKMGVYLPFNQLYTGYGWGSSPVRAAEGVEVIQYFYTVKYMNADGSKVLDIEYVTAGERSDSKLWANEYKVTRGQISENPTPNKKFVAWVNSNSAATTEIAAGNNHDVVLYESWEDPFVIRFVDKDGNVIYSAMFTTSDPESYANIMVPDVPALEGYEGKWDTTCDSKLFANATGDITVNPIYYVGDTYTYVDDPNMSAEKLFGYLEEGKNVIMGTALAHGGGNLSGSNNNMCNMAKKTARLNLNTFTLSCNFGHNANKNWHVFNITDGSHLTISGGVNGAGTLVMNISDIKSPIYFFSLDNTSTLVLEAGVVIEIKYPAGKSNMVFGFEIEDANGKTNTYTFDNYDGIHVENDKTNNVLRITVGITTIINADTLANLQR